MGESKIKSEKLKSSVKSATEKLGNWLSKSSLSPIQPSTIDMLKSYSINEIMNLTAVHGYIYGQWTNEYVGTLINKVIPRLGPKGKQWWADRYHGKVITLDEARKVVQLDHPIQKDLEKVVPYPMAREIVLQENPDIVVYECCCRSSVESPCQPTQVCMLVGKPITDFILEHHPKTAKRVTQQEALDLLEAEHERGHVHSAWFKDAMGGRFYAICNCCRCCCSGVRAMLDHNAPMMAASGYIAEVDVENCSGCGECEDCCPFEAVKMSAENDEEAVISWDACMGCGVCIDRCPSDALSLVRDKNKGEPLDVSTLSVEAN